MSQSIPDMPTRGPDRSLREASEHVMEIYNIFQAHGFRGSGIIQFLRLLKERPEDFTEIMRVNAAIKEEPDAIRPMQELYHRAFEMSTFLLDRIREGIEYIMIEHEGKEGFDRDMKAWESYFGPEVFAKAKKTWL